MINDAYITGVNPYKAKQELSIQLQKLENRSLHSLDEPSVNVLYSFVSSYESMINK